MGFYFFMCFLQMFLSSLQDLHIIDYFGRDLDYFLFSESD